MLYTTLKLMYSLQNNKANENKSVFYSQKENKIFLTL
jgi:hypothetical protein